MGKDTDETCVRVIWYQVDESVDSLALFTRFNIGKIPLTNSELIKALFLSSSSFASEEEGGKMKYKISFLWDEMEQRLSDPEPCYFFRI